MLMHWALLNEGFLHPQYNQCEAQSSSTLGHLRFLLCLTAAKTSQQEKGFA